MSSIASLTRLLSAPLDPGPPRAPEKADAIVILGAPLRADDTLPALAEERVRTGVELYRRGLADVICMTGGHCPRRVWSMNMVSGRKPKSVMVVVTAKLRTSGAPMGAP